MLNKDLTSAALDAFANRIVSSDMRSSRDRRAAVWLGSQLNLHVLCLAVLGAVLVVLAALQYRWIDEVSQAQETRARLRLREEVRLLSDALDTEITRAALVFTPTPVPAPSLYDALAERWTAWQQNAPWPRIVTGVSLAESTRAAWRVRSFGTPGSLDLRAILPADLPPDSTPPGSPSAAESYTEIRIPDLFVRGQPYLLRPVPTVWESAGPPRTGWLLIHYDLGYLAGTVFPRLLEKYSTSDDRLDFRFQLAPKGPAAPAAIAVADQFHFRPDCLMPDNTGGPTLSIGSFRGRAGAVSHVRTFATRVSVQPLVPLASLFQAAGHCQMPVSPANPGLMQLTVRHPRGALSDVFAGFRRRNEIFSGLVLAVLLAALAALVASTERARRLARLQTVVAGGISHELRSPLASLSVTVDHLKNGHVENGEQARRYGEILEAQARRLRNVVDQALALTRLSQPDGVPCRRSVSLPAIINASVESLGPRLREAAVQIHCCIAPDVPAIAADPDLVLRCLGNLLENAVKYAASGGWIQVSARRARHAGRTVAEVVVEDRGPGIQEDETAAVFEPFYRGFAARQSRQPGSGLGLAIVKSAVEAHGGWIKLEPAFPQGCKFRLRFPAADSGRAALCAEAESSQDAIPSDTAG